MDFLPDDLKIHDSLYEMPNGQRVSVAHTDIAQQIVAFGGIKRIALIAERATVGSARGRLAGLDREYSVFLIYSDDIDEKGIGVMTIPSMLGVVVAYGKRKEKEIAAHIAENASFCIYARVPIPIAFAHID